MAADFLVSMDVGFVIAIIGALVTVALIVVLIVWLERRGRTNS